MLNPPGNEVIVISDDEQPAGKSAGGTSKARNKRKAPPSPIVDGDILEIMSSEDEDEVRTNRPPPKKSTTDANSEVAALQKKLKLVQTEAKKELDAAIDRADVIGRDFAQVVAENKQLKASIRDKTKHMLDASLLEDSISCEICTMKMWTPYILPECGHVFCQTCLSDWFSTTLGQHLTLHPNYILNPPLPQHLRHLAIQARSNPNNPHLRSQLEALVMQHRTVAQGPQPVYTCPICREQVKNKPVEDFALKSVVRTLAGVMGESSPTKKANGRGGANGRAGPWDGFFSAGLAL